MIVAGSASPLLLSSAGGYNLTKSLRFRSSATAWLSRTISSNGSATTWTYSTWIKRGTLGTAQDGFIEARVDGLNNTEISFTSSDTLSLTSFNGGSTVYSLTTTQVFRDPSAWYHFVIQVDTTQATSSNRVRLYVNGSQVTAFSSATYPSQNATTYISQTSATHNIGRWPSPTQYFDGYMTEINFIDGQALTPSSFGSTNAATGVWQPIKYTGTYGTNGFYLPFTDTTSTTTLGNDSSGNGNNWTTNNISLTAGTTYDSMTDVPTLTSATTANYCVVNPLSKTSFAIIKGANLNVESVDSSANIAIVGGTFGVTSGKWYWEVTATAVDSTRMAMYVCDATKNGQGLTSSTGAYGYNASGNKIQGDGTNWYGTSSAYGNSWTTNDVIGVALDLDNGKVWFSKNGTWQASGDPAAGTNSAFTSVSGSKTCGMYLYTEASTTSAAFNLGQRAFSYTPPSGFVALNTFNLPTPTIGATASTVANKYMDATLYTGAGNTSTSITNAGGFQPDFVWTKARSIAYSNYLYDAVRGTGTGASLVSNGTGAEGADASNANLSSFNSNGWTIGTTSGTNALNASGQTFVAWQWKANGSGSSNTAGSITSTVSANTTAGFSIVTYTGNGSNSTIGHGLGVAPSFIIAKARNSAQRWTVYTAALGNGYYGYLNETFAFDTANASLRWNTAPTSSVFGVGTSVDVNNNTTTYVAYCFAQIAGYSAFGSYTGNGSTDGTFVYTGFRPRYILMKRTNSTADWVVVDTARSTYNLANAALYPNFTYVEDTGVSVDILSNGFKLKANLTNSNASGSTYIYAAFAETPFKYANAR